MEQDDQVRGVHAEMVDQPSGKDVEHQSSGYGHQKARAHRLETEKRKLGFAPLRGADVYGPDRSHHTSEHAREDPRSYAPVGGEKPEQRILQGPHRYGPQGSREERCADVAIKTHHE